MHPKVRLSGEAGNALVQCFLPGTHDNECSDFSAGRISLGGPIACELLCGDLLKQECLSMLLRPA